MLLLLLYCLAIQISIQNKYVNKRFGNETFLTSVSVLFHISSTLDLSSNFVSIYEEFGLNLSCL